MPHRLAQQLGRVARDHTSGAAQLALEAVQAVEAWLRRHPSPSEAELEEVVVRLLRLQSSMAPILRLANEAALAADASARGPALDARLRGFRHCLERARGRIARHFAASLDRSLRTTVATYSFSSTVIGALVAARSRVAGVFVAESRPTLEGRLTAEKLARAGLPVHYTTDAGLLGLLHSAQIFVVGADAVLSHAFVNKIGTRTAYLAAREAGVPVWVLSDSTKFLPEELAAPFWRPSEGPVAQVWKRAPRGVQVRNPLFEHTELAHAKVITEAGSLEPVEVRQAVEAVRISPRLKRLAD
jgi:translation initiation factor 2B subunit (eIF-2B alpha/beta/delta family)